MTEKTLREKAKSILCDIHRLDRRYARSNDEMAKLIKKTTLEQCRENIYRSPEDNLHFSKHRATILLEWLEEYTNG